MCMKLYFYNLICNIGIAISCESKAFFPFYFVYLHKSVQYKLYKVQQTTQQTNTFTHKT